MTAGELNTNLKTVTTAELKVWDKSGAVVEHIKIDQDGKEEQLQ